MSNEPPTLPKPSVAALVSDHDALPSGTRFGEFEIIRVLGVGGFGIVYLARDHSLERDVALKEYMPASLAARGVGPQITVRSSSFAETYAIGLRSFVNEARLLARFDHPSLVKVYRFWEDNATAYMVMPFVNGSTLREIRRGMAHPPGEAWIRSVITPILSALELLHREGVYHRDIAPDNILLPRQGPPVLLDFGAARRVISDRTQSLTAILKPSYAPIEQYAEMAQLRQGPWTDLYALGAVVHYLLFGVPPAPATARAVQDDGGAIESRVVAGVSPRFLEAMSWMLAIRPNQRPQSGEQLRAVLDGRAEIPPRRSATTIASMAAQAVAAPTLARPLPRGPGAARVDSGMAAPRPAVSAKVGSRRLGWPAWVVGGTAIAIAALAAWQLSARREMPAEQQARSNARATSNAFASPVADTAAATAMSRPAATPVPAASVASAANAPLTPTRALVPVARPALSRAPTLTAGTTLPQSVGSERTPSSNSAALGNPVVPASVAPAHPPGRPVPRVIDATTAVTAATPLRTSEAMPNVPVAATDAATAREACGNRRFFALAACMDRRCEEARYRASPECVGILARKANREGQSSP